MNLKKMAGIALLVLISVGILAAAGQREEAERPVEIQFSISPREVGKVIPEFIDEFEAENPGVTVDWFQVPGVPNEQHTMYVTKMAARDPKPDVLALDVIWPGEFIAHRWAEPLNDYIEQEFFEQFLPGMMNSVTVQGNIYGVPLYTNAIHLFYRKDLLDKHGYGVPATWEELVETAEAVTELEGNPDLNGYISMWAQIEGLFMNYLQFLWGSGGSIFDEYGNLTVNTPEARKALETMVSFVDTGMAPRSILTYNPNDTMTLFRQGRSVFMVVQDFVWPMLQEEGSPVKGNVGMTRVPYFEGNSDANTVCMGGWILAVNPNSPNKEEAVEFIKYITSPDNALTMAVETGCMPARTDMQESQELFASYPLAEDLYANFAVGDVRPSAEAGEKYPELSHIMQREIHSVLTGAKSIDAALRTAQNEIEQLF